MADAVETDRARAIIERARSIAASLGHGRVESAHLLLALLEDSELVEHVLEPLGVRTQRARAEARRLVGRGDAQPTQPIPFSRQALGARCVASAERLMLEPAKQEARWKQAMHDRRMPEYDEEVDAEHLLLGLIAEDEEIAHLLADLGADYDSVRNAVRSFTT